MLVFFIGIVVGSSCALLLKGLEWAKQIRTCFPFILFFLPFAGLLSVFLYKRFGREVQKGNLLILKNIKTPQKPIAFVMAPLIFSGTLLTHIFGGSAGREGSAIQMGAALSQKLSAFLKISFHYQRWILLMGISAGFSACFGTPWAAILFGLEIAGFFKGSKISFKTISKPLLFIALASFWAGAVCHFWGIVHTNYALKNIAILNFKSLFYSCLAGLIFGLGANFFVRLTNVCKFFIGFIKSSYLQIFIGGLIISLSVYFMDWQNFVGLGIESILQYLKIPASFDDFFIKALLTALTIGLGFKGGEVTPLFFMGAALGSGLSGLLPLELPTLSAMGFVGLFAGATKSPLSCVVMGAELFGFSALPFLIVACFMANFVSGKGIYV